MKFEHIVFIAFFPSLASASPPDLVFAHFGTPSPTYVTVKAPTSPGMTWTVEEMERGRILRRHDLPVSQVSGSPETTCPRRSDQNSVHWGRMMSRQVAPRWSWASFWGGTLNLTPWEKGLCVRLQVAIDSFVSGDPNTKGRDFVRPVQSEYVALTRFSVPGKPNWSAGYFHQSSHKTETPLGTGHDFDRSQFANNGNSDLLLIEYEDRERLYGGGVGHLQQTTNTVPHLLNFPAYFFNAVSQSEMGRGDALGALLYATRQAEFLGFEAKAGLLLWHTQFAWNGLKKQVNGFYGVIGLNLDRPLGNTISVGVNAVRNQVSDSDLSIYIRLRGDP